MTAESEKRRRLYETALCNNPDLVYVFDLNHRFTYANEALLTMWGRTWGEAIGKNCLELGYEPWHAAMHDRELEQVIATKQPIRGEVPFTGTQGRRIYDYIFVPVLDVDGEVEAVAGTTRDITERKQAEEALRHSEAQRAALMDYAPVGMYLLDADLHIQYVNPKARPVFGPIDNLIGSDFAEVMHTLWPKKTADEVVKHFRHTLESGESCFVPGFTEERIDRNTREYYDWQIHQVTLPDGQHGVVCYFIDISAHVLGAGENPRKCRASPVHGRIDAAKNFHRQSER